MQEEMEAERKYYCLSSELMKPEDLSEYGVFLTRFELTSNRARIQSVTPYPNLQNVCYSINIIIIAAVDSAHK
jgi:hypothetical protein